MQRFELPLKTRRDLCGSGFHDVDAALRAAAIELDLWFFIDRLHWDVQSDGDFRHYTNFLAWSDTTAIGIGRGIERSGNQALIARWRTLADEPLRRSFRGLRNEALKARRHVAPWRASVEGSKIRLFRSLDGCGSGDVMGRSADYLCWLRDAALPLLLEAITLGTHGDTLLEEEIPLADQMAFPHTDPWTTASDPEFATLMGPNLSADS